MGLIGCISIDLRIRRKKRIYELIHRFFFVFFIKVKYRYVFCEVLLRFNITCLLNFTLDK
ncbi:hypothetical protein DWV34_04900 [Anaerostipes sp. AF04-45]|nr:hypothetical protein DWV34_04900 [Anaerostipes sp. AF04-45]